ncbi:MAG: hypothetical protein GY803_14015, partial [Chloroflexi bacterium]|nr:hypothetical protein [Chloroflexota bacterium]
MADFIIETREVGESALAVVDDELLRGVETAVLATLHHQQTPSPAALTVLLA